MCNLSHLDNLFAPTVQAPVQEKELIEWRPSFLNAPNKTYTAIVRFVPWWQDPSNSILEKFSCYLENPYQPNTGRTVDSPSSIGEKDPISDTYWLLKNSGNAINVENAKKFSRTQKYSMLIQIISDSVNPKLNGRILVWRVGKKVYEKIATEMTPVIAGIQPRNPFDIINGRAFVVKITEASGFNNYDNCQFVDIDKSQSCLKLTEKQEDGTYKFVEAVSETSDKQKVFDFLQANSPDLGKFKYQPWDEETVRYVDSVIAFYTGRTASGAPAQPIASPQKTASLESIINSASAPTPMNVSAQPVAAPVMPQAAAVPNVAPAAPAGLDLNGILPSMPAPEAPGQLSNVSGVDLSGLGDIMNIGTPQVSTAPVTSTPANLDDILNSTFGA